MTNKQISLKDIINGLMNAKHLGDVHQQINNLCRVTGIPTPKGDFHHGWKSDDWRNVGVHPREHGLCGCFGLSHQDGCPEDNGVRD